MLPSLMIMSCLMCMPVDTPPARMVPAPGRPTFTPYTKKPELQNRAAVQSAMVRFYPPALRERGIGGTALMWVLVNEHGEVENVHLKETSGDTLLDRAAEEVVRVMRFSAAMNRNERVKVWVQLPIVFKPAER